MSEDYPNIQFMVMARRDVDAPCSGVEQKLDSAIAWAKKTNGHVMEIHKTGMCSESGYPEYQPQRWVWPNEGPVEDY